MKRRYIMEQSGWMIVRRETATTKIKNYLKKFFYNIFNKKTNICKAKSVEKAEKKEIVIEYLS